MHSENIKDRIDELKEVINTIINRKIDFSNNTLEKNYDFKKKEKEYYAKEIYSAIKKIKTLLSESYSSCTSEQRSNLSKINLLIKELEEGIEDKKFIESLEVLSKIEELSPLSNIEIIDNETFFLPKVPREIFPEIKANFDELQKCFEMHCYRSCIILCGKILEVALHTKYYQITEIDLLEKSPDIGLGNLVAKLSEKGYESDPGLMQQIHLINQLRVFSVHKKKQVFIPSKAQCQATILYTLDAIKKLFKDENKR